MIAAGGSSRRMGTGARKEFAEIDGDPVILRTVSRFPAIPGLVRIVVTSRTDSLDRLRSLLDSRASLLGPATITVIPGGATRQESVRLGLEALAPSPPDYVLIHDGARPWVDEGVIRRVLRGTIEHGACVPVVRSVDALKRVIDGLCIEHPDRDEIVCVQTPQGFAFAPILEAHRSQGGRTFVDDAEILAAAGGRVYTVAGDPANRKITYPHDLRPGGSR